uniref:Uncharacterized protein n=1 Tax=Labrus bergylta TaxID=56723 RepID=A0A3Q3FCC0_9LABR
GCQMMSHTGGTIYAWLENPVKFEKSNGVNITLDAEIVQKSDNEEEETHILIVDSALHLRTFARWAEPMLIYFHPEQHGARPPHPPPGLFHGHLWLMHLKLCHSKICTFGATAFKYLIEMYATRY